MAVRTLHHAAEGRVEAEGTKRVAKVGAIDAARVIAEGMLAAFEISHQRQIGIARLRVRTGAAGVHDLEGVIAVGAGIDAEQMRRVADQHRDRARPELGSE